MDTILLSQSSLHSILNLRREYRNDDVICWNATFWQCVCVCVVDRRGIILTVVLGDGCTFKSRADLCMCVGGRAEWKRDEELARVVMALPAVIGIRLFGAIHGAPPIRSLFQPPDRIHLSWLFTSSIGRLIAVNAQTSGRCGSIDRRIRHQQAAQFAQQEDAIRPIPNRNNYFRIISNRKSNDVLFSLSFFLEGKGDSSPLALW